MLSCLVADSSSESDPIGTRFRDFEDPDHALRGPAWTHPCIVVYRWPLYVPRSRDREKQPAAG